MSTLTARLLETPPLSSSMTSPFSSLVQLPQEILDKILGFVFATTYKPINSRGDPPTLSTLSILRTSTTLSQSAIKKLYSSSTFRYDLDFNNGGASRSRSDFPPQGLANLIQNVEFTVRLPVQYESPQGHHPFLTPRYPAAPVTPHPQAWGQNAPFNHPHGPPLLPFQAPSHPQAWGQSAPFPFPLPHGPPPAPFQAPTRETVQTYPAEILDRECEATIDPYTTSPGTSITTSTTPLPPPRKTCLILLHGDRTSHAHNHFLHSRFFLTIKHLTNFRTLRIDIKIGELSPSAGVAFHHPHLRAEESFYRSRLQEMESKLRPALGGGRYGVREEVRRGEDDRVANDLISFLEFHPLEKTCG